MKNEKKMVQDTEERQTKTKQNKAKTKQKQKRKQSIIGLYLIKL